VKKDLDYARIQLLPMFDPGRGRARELTEMLMRMGKKKYS